MITTKPNQDTLQVAVETAEVNKIGEDQLLLQLSPSRSRSNLPLAIPLDQEHVDLGPSTISVPHTYEEQVNK